MMLARAIARGSRDSSARDERKSSRRSGRNSSSESRGATTRAGRSKEEYTSTSTASGIPSPSVSMGLTMFSKVPTSTKARSAGKQVKATRRTIIALVASPILCKPAPPGRRLVSLDLVAHLSTASHGVIVGLITNMQAKKSKFRLQFVEMWTSILTIVRCSCYLSRVTIAPHAIRVTNVTVQRDT